MFSRNGIIELIRIILNEKEFVFMSDEELLDNIDLIKKRLNELKAEYVFRVHMENGLESYDDLSEIIDDNNVYKYLLICRKNLKGNKYSNLNVKDLNDYEEYRERHLLNIPNKVITLKEKDKTR